MTSFRDKVTSSDLLWSYLAQAVNIGSGLLVLPLIISHLSSEEVALWYIFSAIGSFIILLDFGFSPTLSRNFTFALNGSHTLSKRGLEQQSINYKSNEHFVKALLLSSKFIYLVLATFILIILWSVGTFFLYSLDNTLDQNDLLMSWLMYSLGASLNLLFSFFNTVLVGQGKIRESNIVIFTTRFIFIFTAFILVFQKLNLAGLACAYLISAIAGRIIAYFYTSEFLKKFNSSDFSLDRSIIKETIRTLWYTAWRLGLVGFGGFFINRANIFLSSKNLGVEQTASYALTLQIFTIGTSLSSSIFRVFLPQQSKQRIQKNKSELIISFKKAWVLSTLNYLFFAVSIYFFAPLFVEYFSKDTQLLSLNLIFILIIYYFLELNHSNCATFITTKNEVPFLRSSLVSGSASFLLSWALLNYWKSGYLALILSPMLIQLLYNNWKWPYEVYKELN